jgi:uncharacterized membrane protein YdjX (TVP38/TMEM64 family)
VTEDAAQNAESRAFLRTSLLRVGALLLVTGALVLAAYLSGAYTHLRPKEIQERMARAGIWGPIGYLVAFTAGELIHVPGTVFVAAAVVAYGRTFGTALAYLGAVVSLSTSFAVVRAVGGQPLAMIRWRFVRRLLGHLDDRPIRTIIVVRLIFWLTPQVNYALALSRVPFRSYLIGSAVGLLLPVTILGLALDYFIN